MTQEQDTQATQASAITTLVGLVAYMAYELSRAGALNVAHFRQHLIDLDTPDRLDESPAERAMRQSILAAVRGALAEGEDLAARD